MAVHSTPAPRHQGRLQEQGDQQNVRNALGWESVYVFISSTFDDMLAERDYLVKDVFPRLRDWCERRRLWLFDIDLRWGVTEADAARDKRAVELCLRAIDRSRAALFFVGLLGQRYGWVPDQTDVSPTTLDEFPDLQRYLGNASLTELEILHAAVSPLKPGLGVALDARFYVRDPSYLADLPPVQRDVYHEPNEQKAGRLAALKTNLRSHYPVRDYLARWNPKQRTTELAMPLDCPSHVFDTQAEWRRAWQHLGVEPTGLSLVDDEQQRLRAEAHNRRRTQGRLVAFRCGSESLGDVILADLELAILRRFPNRKEPPIQTDLEREIEQHHEFVELATLGFIERESEFAPLDRWLQNESDRRLMVLAGPGGTGKSSLLAQWVKRQRDCHSRVLYRFIGYGDRSSEVDSLLELLLRQLASLGCLDGPVPDGPRRLRERFPAALAQCGANGQTLIVLDGLDQLDSGLSDVDWLPTTLPEGIKLIVSARVEKLVADPLPAHWRDPEQVKLHEQPPFTSVSDRKRLVHAYLEQFLKQIDDEPLHCLLETPGSDNPLFLKVVLSELRVFGSFPHLREKLRGFGHSPDDAFESVLKRLEGDPVCEEIEPSEITRVVFGLLAHSRHGLPEAGLVDMAMTQLGLPRRRRSRVEAAIAILLRQVRWFLARREGRVDLLHESFRDAARRRYAGGATPAQDASAAWHRRLAAWCERWGSLTGVSQRYALANLVHHHTGANQLNAAAAALADFSYQYQRLGCEGALAVPGVMRELAEVRSLLGPNARFRRQLSAWQEFVGENAHLLRGEPTAGARSAIGSAGTPEREVPREVRLLELAYAHASASPVTRSAERWLACQGVDHVWRRAMRRPRMARAPILHTLESPAQDGVSCMAYALGRDWLVSGHHSGSLRFWDLDTGVCMRTLRGHQGSVLALVVHPDGQRIVSAGADSRLMVWSADSGQSAGVLQGHEAPVMKLVLSADGRRVVSGDSAGAIRVWNLATGACAHALVGHEKKLTALVAHPDGCRIVSAGEDCTIRVWGIESGEALACWEEWRYLLRSAGESRRRLMQRSVRALVEQRDQPAGRGRFHVPLDELMWHDEHDSVTALVLDPKGSHVTFGLSDGTVRVRDLEEGATLARLQPRAERLVPAVTTLTLDATGQLLATASEDAVLRIWHPTSHRCLHELRGHRVAVIGVHLLAKGRRVVSIDAAGVLKIWELSEGEGRCLCTRDEHRVVPIAAPLWLDDGRAASADPAGTILIWHLESVAVARDAAFETVPAGRYPGARERARLASEALHRGARHAATWTRQQARAVGEALTLALGGQRRGSVPAQPALQQVLMRHELAGEPLREPLRRMYDLVRSSPHGLDNPGVLEACFRAAKGTFTMSDEVAQELAHAAGAEAGLVADRLTHLEGLIPSDHDHWSHGAADEFRNAVRGSVWMCTAADMLDNRLVVVRGIELRPGQLLLRLEVLTGVTAGSLPTYERHTFLGSYGYVPDMRFAQTRRYAASFCRKKSLDLAQKELLQGLHPLQRLGYFLRCWKTKRELARETREARQVAPEDHASDSAPPGIHL